MTDLPSDETMEVILRDSTTSDNELKVNADGSINTNYSVLQEPTFICTFPYAGYGTFGSNAQQAIIYNTNATKVIKIHKVIFLPDSTTRTGAMPGIWYTWRRVNPSTAPSGSTEPVTSHDTTDSLPSGISCFHKPSTAAAGGTLHTLTIFTPQADEMKLTTLDAPTMAALFEGFGTTIYDSSWGINLKPITIRQNQSFEVAQTATGGTGNFRLIIIFSVI